jgi:hypothetical protein
LGIAPTRDTVLVSKGLELAVSPAVEDPVLDVDVGVLSSVLSLIPRVLNLSKKGVLVGLGAFLSLNTLLLEVGRELVRIPVLVRGDSIAVPVLLDQVLEILAVGRGRVWDVVVRQPTLELSLMPLVVSWKLFVSPAFSMTGMDPAGCLAVGEGSLVAESVFLQCNIPALLNQLLPMTEVARARVVRLLNNLMMN